MDNFDPQELEKFGKMAASWWDPEGDFKPIHLLNPVRLEYIETQSRGLVSKNILDVGCGGGILAESMAKRGAKVTGIEMSEKPLEVARQHAQKSGLGINYQLTTIEQFATNYQGEKFDVITCMEMLEHVPSPEQIIKTCQQLLKPDGRLFFATINRTLKAWALVIVGAEYVLRMLPKGTHEFEKFIKPAELLNWCEQYHLESVSMQGYHYNPLTQKFWLNNDVSSNYLVVVKHNSLNQ